MTPTTTGLVPAGLGGPFLVTEGLGPAPFFEQDLVGFLKSLTGLVATPGRVPQGSPLPALAFRVVDWDRDYKLDGPAGLAEARVEIEARSSRYLEVGRISEAIRVALVKVRYPMGATRVDACLLEDQSSDYQAAVDGSDDGSHGKASTFAFRYSEA